MSILLDVIRLDVESSDIDGYESHCTVIVHGSYREKVVVFPNLEISGFSAHGCGMNAQKKWYQ